MAPANAAALCFASSSVPCSQSQPSPWSPARPPAATMATTKLNPAAAPFPCPYAHHLAPPAPPPFPLVDACPPRFPLITYYCVASPSPHGRLGFQPVLRKGFLAAPPPHGRPPHKLMAAFSGPCGAGKLQTAASMKPRQVRAVAAAAAAPAQVPSAAGKPRAARQKAENRSQGKALRPWTKAAGPRARLAEQRETTPSSLYTTPPPQGVTPKPSELGESTTIMLRNIPNKLRSGDIINLLDEHCSRVNRAAGAVIAAYDVLYLPMDFRKEGNFGYAFINFTTSEAANGLYYSLQNCGWRVHGSKKVIKIDQAIQQGKANLLRHLEKLTLECDKDEFLPAEFSPPRDGVNVPAAPRRIRRVGGGRQLRALRRLSATPAPVPTPTLTLG